MLARLLKSSRYILLIAVVGAFVAALVALVAGAAETVHVAAAVVAAPGEAKHQVHALVEVVDLFLLGTVFYVVALGLYELFIDETLEVPKWLRISSLDDLKHKLLGVVTLSLIVQFLGVVDEWDGSSWTIIAGGGAIALVIAAITLVQRSKRGFSRPSRQPV